VTVVGVSTSRDRSRHLCRLFTCYQRYHRARPPAPSPRATPKPINQAMNTTTATIQKAWTANPSPPKSKASRRTSRMRPTVVSQSVEECVCCVQSFRTRLVPGRNRFRSRSSSMSADTSPGSICVVHNRFWWSAGRVTPKPVSWSVRLGPAGRGEVGGSSLGLSGVLRPA
jgi:hypothetical protein